VAGHGGRKKNPRKQDADRSPGNATLYTYLGITATNYVHDETKFRKYRSPLNSEYISFCYLPENL
jgi:hypothetical protein